MQVQIPVRTATFELPEAVGGMLAKMTPSPPEALREYEWETVIQDHLRGAQLPQRFRYEIRKWVQPQQRAAFNKCGELLKRNGAIIALIGERGLGKTTIAAQLIIQRAWDESLVPWERRPPYRKMSGLIAQFKALHADFGSVNTESLLERKKWLCRKHPLLIIDELHDCDDLRMKDRVLTDLLDQRYANLLDTVLISNQSPEEFKQTTSDSILSRLSEHGTIIHCKWNSFRERPVRTDALQELQKRRVGAEALGC